MMEKRKKNWFLSEGQISLLKREYPKENLSELSEKIGVSYYALVSKAIRLGIKRDKKVHYQFMKDKIGKKNNFYGKKHTKDSLKKMGDASSKNNKKTWKNPETRKRRIEGIKKKWDDPEHKEFQLRRSFDAQQKTPNLSERKVLNIIEKNNLSFYYAGDGKVWFRGDNHSFNPDFLSKNSKHIIEVFGDYWHNRPDMKKRDKERLRTYKKYGYKTLILWQHELDNVNLILNKINMFIKNG